MSIKSSFLPESAGANHANRRYHKARRKSLALSEGHRRLLLDIQNLRNELQGSSLQIADATRRAFSLQRKEEKKGNALERPILYLKNKVPCLWRLIQKIFSQFPGSLARTFL